jgi:adenine-specific DNA-methyltransferase
MDKLKLHTPDLTAANVERIAALFPNCVTEATDETGKLKRAIDFDLLKQELSADLVEGPQERYRLDWPGKREALALANTPVALTLRPCREESVDFETTKNLYIEGDNLDALKLLQETYLGKVKMIYIDPPYNTGNDFIYDDDFSMSRSDYQESSGEVDEEGNAMFDEEKWKQNSSSNGRFHSEWLSMIYPRLKLARNLMTDDGLILISIDKGEVSNLRKTCDEVFGESNFRGLVSRVTGTPSGQGYGILVNELDYVLVYSRSESAFFSGLPFSEDNASIYDQEDERGKYLLRPLRKTGGEDRKEDRPTMHYPIETPDGSIIFPVGPGGYESRWRCGRDTYNELCTEGRIEWKKSSSSGDASWKVYQKFYLEGRTKQPSDLWRELEGNKKGSLEAKALFNAKIFESPKPTDLVRHCLQIAADSKSIILDFFSGSATTAHAVMQLNAEDGGKRRHIMVQLPELCDEKSEAFKAGYKTIAEIGKERIRRAGKKILAEWQEKQAKEKPTQGDLLDPSSPICDTPSPPDIGFRVLKIDSSNFADIHRTPDALDQKELALHTEHIKPERAPEDLLFQVLVDWGVDLALPITEEVIDGKHVFFVDGNALTACFDTGLTDELIKAIAARKPMRAVFRDESYGDDSTRINVGQLFKLLSPNTELKSL